MTQIYVNFSAVFFFFGDGTKIIFWDFDTFTYVATCEMYVVTPRRRRNGSLDFTNVSGVLYYSLTSSRCKDSYLPQRIDTKNAKWRAAAMNFYFDVIRWFTNYTNFNESFSRLFQAFYLVRYVLMNYRPGARFWLYFYSSTCNFWFDKISRIY